MRLPSIVKPNAAVLFQPNRRIDVYHRAAERAGKPPLLVAEVYTDGVQGRVRVLDARFAGIVEPLFTEASVRFSPHGGGTADGISADGTVVKLKPWKPEAVDQVVAEELVRWDLRGEIVPLR